MIAEWQSNILNAWIHVAKEQQDPTLGTASAERAELALARIVEWYNRGGYWLMRSEEREGQDPLPVPSFLRLCRFWLHLDTADGFVSATDLLIAGKKDRPI